jgi:hypothetical protein
MSLAHCAQLDDSDERRAALTEREAAFIRARDGFYKATVSETGLMCSSGTAGLAF